MGLRDRAAELSTNNRSKVGALLESLEDNAEKRAEVLDVLTGAPLLSHAGVAKALTEEFPEVRYTDDDVRRWRAKNQ